VKTGGETPGAKSDGEIDLGEIGEVAASERASRAALQGPMPDHRKSFVLASVEGPVPRDLVARLAGPGLVQDRPGAPAVTGLFASGGDGDRGVLLLHAPDGFPARGDRVRARLERRLAGAHGRRGRASAATKGASSATAPR
jgi:hypothetical protein